MLKTLDLQCAHCGHVLRNVAQANFCENCGLPTRNASETSAQIKRAFVTDLPESRPGAARFLDLLGPLAALAAYRSGANFVESLIVLVCVVLLVELVLWAWRSILRPTKRKLVNEGLVGAGKAFHQKIVMPLLYGKHGQSKK